MNTIAHRMSRSALRSGSVSTYRYILYAVNAVLLVSTVVVMEWDRHGHESVRKRMDQYHLTTVTRAVAIKEEITVVENALIARALETLSPDAMANGELFLPTYPDAAASLYLADSELGKIVETQSVFRGLEYEKLVPRTKQQFFDLNVIISGGLYQRSEVETAQRQLTALTLSLEQLRRLHRSEHAELTKALPGQERLRHNTLIGVVVGLLVISHVTTRQILKFIDATDALRESEERYRAVAEDMPVLISRFLPGGEITYVNDAFRKYFEKSTDELVGHTFLSLIPEAERETVMANIAALTVDSPTHSLEHQVIAPGGELRWQRWTNRALFDGEGTAVAYQSIGEDITERKRAKEELRLSAEIAENMAEGISLIRVDDGIIMYTNDRFNEIFGYGKGELTGQHSAVLNASGETNPEEIPSKIINGFEEDGNRHGEILNIKKDRTEFWSHANVSIFEHSKYGPVFLTVQEDITERKRAEEAHRENEQRYRNLFEQAPLSIWEEDFSALGQWLDELRSAGVRDLRVYLREHPQAIQHAAGLIRIVDLNEGTLTMFEAESREELLTPPSDDADDATRQSYTDSTFVDQLVAIWNGKSRFEAEFSATTLKGNKRECLLQWAAPRGKSGLDLSHLIVVISDVTELKRAEKELLLKQFAIDHSSLPIYWVKADGGIAYANQAACRSLGYGEEEILSMSVSDFDPDFPREIWPEHWGQFKESGTATFEARHRTKQGRVFPVEITTNYLEHEGREYIWAYARDITERKLAEEEKRRLQERLRHTQKMDAVGKLAAGVAHEFNNILVGILGNAELLLAAPGGDLPERFKRPLKDIKRSGTRAADLTKQLLSFARKKNPNVSLFDVNQVIADGKGMLQRLVGAGITLKTVLASDPALVRADEAEIEQAILNLVMNARDAMPNGGTLAIQTDFTRLKANEVAPDCKPGRYVRLSVIDDGCGMPPEVAERIFEPFFTTKPVGEGTGLGLSTIFADVTNSGGFVKVESRVGEGTVIRVHFPQAEGAIETTGAGAEHASSPVGGNETILVCDDEEIVLASVAALLQTLGYPVICANSPQEAMEAAAAQDGPISLLLTDVTMPGMDGIELSKEIIRFYPDIRVVLTSGYAEDVLQGRAGENKHFRFLQKPVPYDMLARTIREALD